MRVLFLLMLVVMSQSGCSIPREDVLECGLADGSKFVLRAKYDWNPVANLIPADVAERLNQQPFMIEYHLPDSRKAIAVKDQRSYQVLEENENADFLCSTFSKVNSITQSHRQILLEKTDFFIEVPYSQRSTLPQVEVPNWIAEVFRKRNLVNSYSGFIYTILGDRLVYEDALVSNRNNCILKSEGFLNDCPIVAVFKSESLDMGKTWSNPLITTDAEIFELNKPILEQSFIARPVSINGKKIKAKFPPQRQPKVS